MYLQAVCIDRHGVAAYGRKVKPTFSFLDEVLHLAPTAVKLNSLIRLQFLHRCNDERKQVYHLSVRFLNLENHSPRMRPAAGLIIKFTVFDSVINLVSPGRPVKGFVCVCRVMEQRGILFQADRVLAVVFFTGIVKIRRSKATVAP